MHGMKIYRKRLVSWGFALLYFVAMLGFPQISSGTVLAADECNEARLRDLKVAIINCAGNNACETGITEIGGTDNIAKIFNYFLGKGLKDFQIAGMLGNMKHESGIQPQVVQGKPGVVTPVESLTPEQLSNSRLGYGLVQWTPVRKMIDPVRAAGKDPNDLVAQLDFLWDQLEGRATANEKAAGDHLKATTDVASATLSFETKYERHAGPPQPQRIADAEEILNNARMSGATTATATSATPTGLSKVYILGDSITHGAAPKYNEVFGAKGITPTISAVTGRSWTTPGVNTWGATGTAGPARDALTTDQGAVRDAGAIVVALGTNGGLGSNPVEEVVAAIRAINPSAPIYWVNIAATTPAVSPLVTPFNTKLTEQQATGKFTVLDWAKTVDATGNGTTDSASLLQDGIHPNTNGYQRLVDLVVNGVVGGAGASNSSGCGQPGATSGSGLTAKILAYAWPDYHPKPFTEKMPEYAAAITNAKAEGRYVGNDGIDCGGFVTTLMIDSGFDVSYNSSGRGGATPIQKQWLDTNWQALGEITSTSQLQQGDVAMQPGHTYVFTGDIPGFNSQFASASNGERAPMAGKYEKLSGDGIVWYRKK